MSPTSQKAKLIARLQTYVPLYDWPLLDELAESNGPSERDAVLEEAALCAESCDVFSSDAIEVSERIRALKNAAPQAGPSAGNHSGEDFRPARAASEAGADDGWRPIATAPKDGTWILGINNRGNCAVIIWSYGPDWRDSSRQAAGWIHPFTDGSLSTFWNGANGSWPTHWMPLPAAPKSNATDRDGGANG